MTRAAERQRTSRHPQTVCFAGATSIQLIAGRVSLSVVATVPHRLTRDTSQAKGCLGAQARGYADSVSKSALSTVTLGLDLPV